MHHDDGRMPPAMTPTTDTPYATLSTRQQAYSDVIVTAVEGGINYWARCKDYRWQDASGTENAASVAVRVDGEWKTITTREIASAFSKLSKGEVLPRQNAYWRKAYRDVATGDWDYDAADADVIFQIAALDDVVYG
jgi:hypothetical protein